MKPYISKSVLIKIILLLLVVMTFSCGDIKDSNIEPKASFNKVYNSKTPDDNIYPLDIKQTADGGYLVLSEGNERSLNLLRVDPTGEVIADTTLTNYKSPLPGLFEVANELYFFCRDEIGITTAVKIPPDSLNLLTATQVGIDYPLSVGKTSDGFIFQSWNKEDKKTIVTKVSNTFQMGNSAEFEIEDDMEAFISNHLFRKGPRLPFLSGEIAGGKYYFNGYNDYNFDLVFLDNGLKLTGSVAGYKTEKFITSLYNITTTNKFAITSSEYETNYFLPNTNVNTNTPNTISDLKLSYIPEMSRDIPVITKQIKVNAVDIILCAFTTKTKQVALYGYKIDTGELLGKYLIGNTNPYEIGNFSNTSDEGLVVAAKTQVAGKFPRIAIIKFSKNELNNLFGKK